MKSKLFKTFLILSVLLSLLIVTSVQAKGSSTDEDLVLVPVSDAEIFGSGQVVADKNAKGAANYIIRLSQPALAAYAGNIDGLAATNIAVTGAPRLVNSDATVAYLNYLDGVQAEMVTRMETQLGRELGNVTSLKHAVNVIIAVLTPEEAAQIAKMTGVVRVTREVNFELDTDAGPAWIGAPAIWSGTGTPDGIGTKGEGMVVAILDTGINHDHPSFADVGGDGYDHTNPLGAGNYIPGSECITNASFCNDKLIGAWDFVNSASDAGSPEDSDGHGSHTASTVAGNEVEAVLYAPTAAITSTISGVAPHANIIAYDVCITTCPSAALIGAANQVLIDSMALPNGIAALNYSISGGTSPYAEDVELAFLALTTDGSVLVSASAGNGGPGPGTSAHLSPWDMTVAASTHNRNLVEMLTDITSDGTNLADLEGVGFTSGYGPARIVYAGDYPNSNDPTGNPAQCLQPYPAGTWTAGEIVICLRGTIARVAKGSNVMAGGAAGMVLINPVPQGIVADAHVLPALHLESTVGLPLIAWLDNASNTNAMATISGVIVDTDPANGDIMAGFSSRGPNVALEVIKPDITAPGVNIWAAIETVDPSDPAEYGFLSGTSMSSPHNAGSATLVTAVHPTWSPSEIKSAMMMTAHSWMGGGILKEDGITSADPFDVGAGRVNLHLATRAAFVMDETLANYEGANPADGGDPTTLNLPSFTSESCVQTCSWTRTISSTVDYDVTWSGAAGLNGSGVMVSVDPVTFTLPAYGMQVITVTADVSSLPAGEWAFSQVNLSPYATGAMGMYTSNPNVAIPDGGYNGTLASMACNTINTTGLFGMVDQVWVELNMAHTWVGDLTVKLQSPSGNVLTMLNRPGSTAADDGTDSPFGDSSNLTTAAWLTFGDGLANNAETLGSGGTSAWNICTQDGLCEYYPNRDTATTFGAFADFAGETAAGNWQLCVGDSAASDTGTLAGWELHFHSSAPPSMNMPMAVIPSLGFLPDSIDIMTRRDAGSWESEAIESIAASDLTVEMEGPFPAHMTHFMLAQDPTNSTPYDVITGTGYSLVEIPAGINTFWAAVVSSSSPDIDMFVGMDDNGNGMPDDGEDICTSATGTSAESCTIINPAAGTYWVLVQNWQASATPPDHVELHVVLFDGTDTGLFTTSAPASVGALEPYTVEIWWDEPSLEEGDMWYANMSLGTDSANPGNIGTIPVTLYRAEDDVWKTSELSADGSVITYTITVLDNVMNTDLTYWLTDTMPAGTTYVPGSATGGAVVTGDELTWEGVMPEPGFTYNYYDSTTSTACATHSTLVNSGSYINLQPYGLLANSGISGDTFDYFVTVAQPVNYFGEWWDPRLHFTDDGFTYLEPGAPGLTPWNYAPIGSGNLPNNMMAFFWRDLEVVYNAGTNTGVTIATLSSGGVPVASLIEYDDIENWGTTGQTYDVEILTYFNNRPSGFEIVMAYDNINGPLGDGTIGLEDINGDGVEYAYDDIAVTNGMAICWDMVPSAAPHTISYAVTLDTPGTACAIGNSVYHQTDNPGSEEAMAWVDGAGTCYRTYMPVIIKK